MRRRRQLYVVNKVALAAAAVEPTAVLIETPVAVVAALEIRGLIAVVAGAVRHAGASHCTIIIAIVAC